MGCGNLSLFKEVGEKKPLKQKQGSTAIFQATKAAKQSNNTTQESSIFSPGWWGVEKAYRPGKVGSKIDAQHIMKTVSPNDGAICCARAPWNHPFTDTQQPNQTQRWESTIGPEPFASKPLGNVVKRNRKSSSLQRGAGKFSLKILITVRNTALWKRRTFPSYRQTLPHTVSTGINTPERLLSFPIEVFLKNFPLHWYRHYCLVPWRATFQPDPFGRRGGKHGTGSPGMPVAKPFRKK